MKELLSIQVIFGIAMILAGWIGYKIKSFIAIKQEFISKAADKRRKIYQDFIDIEIGPFRDIETAGEKTIGQRAYMQNLVGKLYEFYIPFLLYASPTTVKNFGEFMQYLHTGTLREKEFFELLGKVIFSMRKEIGLSNKGLQEVELFKPIFKRYKQVFGEPEAK